MSRLKLADLWQMLVRPSASVLSSKRASGLSTAHLARFNRASQQYVQVREHLILGKRSTKRSMRPVSQSCAISLVMVSDGRSMKARQFQTNLTGDARTSSRKV